MQSVWHGRYPLRRFFSSFPEGWFGAGLIILRFTMALHIVQDAFALLLAADPASLKLYVEAALAIVFGIAITIGFLTPVLCAMLLGTGLYLLVISFGHAFLPDMTLLPIALLLLGPGAYSVDARLFGLRRIIIPEGRRPPPR